MEGYTSEQEQLESIKQWWRKYGKIISVGILLGIVAVGGYQWSQRTQQKTLAAASSEYEKMLESLDKKDLAMALQSAQRLTGADYADTAYAPLAALALARIKLEQGDSVAAQKQLRWALDHAEEPAIAHVARLRLARLLLVEGQAKEAQTLLNTVSNTGSFTVSYDELKGDIAVALNQPSVAAGAYKRALAARKSGEDSSDLQAKLDDLGLTDSKKP